MNIDKKTAKEKFVLSKHKDTYEIKGFSGVSFRSAPGHKGSGYEYFFGSDRIPREIVIPDEIDGLPVTKVAVKCLPDDAVVFCRGELYAKLTRPVKAGTARAYLEDPFRFAEDEAEQIGIFIKKYSEDAAAALCGSDRVEAYARFLDAASPKFESIERLLAAAEGKPEVKAFLLDRMPKEKPAEPDAFAPKKITVTEFKKLWTYREYTDGQTGEKFIELSNYKGSGDHVVIPAMLGKTPIRILNGAFPAHVRSVDFEDPGIKLKCKFANCKAMADENGFIVIRLGDRAVLTDYIGPRDVDTLVIPEGVTETAYGVFSKLKIRKAVFPVGFEKLAGGSFFDCNRLQAAELPDGLREIGQLAFANCPSLKALYIPASVGTIGLFDFHQHAEIYGEPGSAAQAFAEEHAIPFHEGRIPGGELSPFVITDGILERYLGSDRVVTIPEGITEIASNAFAENEKLVSVTILEGVEKLASFAFSGCRVLETVSLPGSLRLIGSFAFSDCYALKRMILPEGVTTIDDNAFSFCYALEEIFIPASVELIGKDAFCYCSNLTIHAPAGSCAEQYAKENNIPFAAE